VRVYGRFSLSSILNSVCEDYRLTQQSAFAPIEVWSQIQHPNIIAVREAFTTRSFGDNCKELSLAKLFSHIGTLALVVVYAYYPNAETLYDAHIKPKVPAYQQPIYYGRHQQLQKYQQAHHQLLAERTLWSYIAQLASAIKKVHERGQAVRMLDVTKILVTGQNRFVIPFHLESSP
jgi:PAB-dependent poly(A)-specific ribonuclease subunit 3